MNWKSWLALSLLSVITAGCEGTSGGPVDGRVVDEETGQGIPGAFVIVRWTGILGATSIGGSPADVCYHVEVVKSEADGRYHVPRWTTTNEDQPHYVEGMNFHANEWLLVSAYVPDYELGKRSNERATDVLLRKSIKAYNERAYAIGRMLHGWSACTTNSRNNKLKFVDVWRTIQSEQMNLARTPKEKEDAADTTRTIEELEFGGAEALRRAAERRIEAQRSKKQDQK